MSIKMNNAGTGRRTATTMAGALAAASILVLAGCSGDTGDSGESSPSGSDTTVVIDAMGPIDQVDAPTEPFTVPTDKHILILSCGSAGQGCVIEAEEQKRVAESLGWTVDVIDGKLDPTVWNQTVKQAVDSGVDGIIAVSADPNLYGDAMESVAAAGVPFVLTQQTPGDQDVEGISTYIAPDPKVGGADVAEWLIADSDGQAHVLLLDVPGFTNVQQRTAAIAATLEADCPDCVVYKADITPATLGTSLAPLVTSQLQQHPDIDYIWGSDDCCVSFMQQGIQQAGRTGTVKLMSMTGYPQQMTQLTTGEMDLELASPTPFSAWLAVDSLARLMAEQPTQEFWVLPQRIWTAANIDEAPESVFEKGWDIEFDYQSMFQELWGTN